jgi:hypothetical protein
VGAGELTLKATANLELAWKIEELKWSPSPTALSSKELRHHRGHSLGSVVLDRMASVRKDDPSSIGQASQERRDDGPHLGSRLLTFN